MKLHIFIIAALVLSALARPDVINMFHYQGDAPVSSYQCLANRGHRDILFEAQTPSGQPNSFLGQMVRNAEAAGFKNIGYLFLPPVSLEPSLIIKQVRDALPTTVDSPGFMMWLDVSWVEKWWLGQDGNCRFLTKVVTEAQNAFGRQRVGIRSNSHAWQTIFGHIQACPQQLPLWYLSPDNRSAPDDIFELWADFAGWTRADVQMKNYSLHDHLCGTYVDRSVVVE